MKLYRYGGVATTVAVSALALTACGSDDNTTGGTAGGAASSAASAVTSAAASATGGATSSAPSASSTSGGGELQCATGSLNAEGSSAQGNAMDAWIAGYQERCPGVQINYNPSGSGAGIKSFTQGSVAFAGSDSALKDDEQGPADQRCKTGKAINIPMVVGPIAVAYNLEGVDSLQLKPATLANIMLGKVKTWNDASIAADNPGASLPSTPIRLIYRSDESGTTENFQKYLAGAAPRVWTEEPSKSWPKNTGGEGAVKSQGVADAVKRTPGAIGYVEKSFADGSELSTAKLGVGSEYVELTPDAAGKSLEAAEVEGSGNDIKLSLDYATTEAGVYPAVLVTYEITCASGLPAEQANLVKSFLTYTASDEGQQLASSPDGGSYAPLPASIAERVRQSVSSIAAG